MKVLVTGATGYIGRRLVRKLLDEGVSVRVMVRSAAKLGSLALRCEVATGDSLSPETLPDAVSGVDVVYYLIHSMGSGADFAAKDAESAANMRDACINAGVRKLIYLGGLGSPDSSSEHLASRNHTGEILSARKELQVITFRAGVIIGSGSLSFEIIRNLTEKLPVMITPKWVRTMTEPVGVGDVLRYLSAAKDLPDGESVTVDIGAEKLSFAGMMQGAAEVMGLWRKMIPVPFLSPKLSSYWLILFTPVPYSVASALVEGLRSETVKLNDNAARLFPDIHPVSYRQAVAVAINEIAAQQVESRWCDSTGGEVCDVLFDSVAEAVYTDRYTFPYPDGITAEAVFRSVSKLGGDEGWFASQPLWRIRGFVDKLVGGAGLNRGRRLPDALRVGDSLDFWKVVDVRTGKRILLHAQMKLPGRAWLEFVTEPERLVMTAYYYPKGVAGRLYWYAMYPAHLFVFRNMGKNLLERAAIE